ncbi:MAG: outer membrane protein assembly factor BamD [Bacteroidota bacterium]
MSRTLFPITLILVLLSSCKSEFEAIRTSGNAEKMFAKANEYYAEEEFDKAITLYELVIPSYRGKREAEDLYFNFANAHYILGRYILSAHYFNTFSETYAVSPRREEALYLKAMSHYELSPKYKLDQADSEKAIEAFQFYVNSYPDSEKVGDCNEHIDELRRKMERKEFDAGRMYYNTRNYSSAIQALENMLKDYPESEQAEEARFLIAKSSYDWAENSIFLRQQERYEKTVQKCKYYLKKYPESRHTDEVTNFQNAALQQLENIQNG